MNRPNNKQAHNNTLGSAQSGLVISRLGNQAEVEAQEGDLRGQIHRCHLRNQLDGLVTGDVVTWRPGKPTGVIEAIEERRSMLLRPDKYSKPKPVAANIDYLIIVIAPEPQAFPNLIDRYLIAAHASHIQPLIVLNKADNIADIKTFMEQQHLAIYPVLGYRWFTLSAVTGQGMGPLQQLLQHATSVFVGQSGVGKSSLINSLLPQAHTLVGELSAIGKGSHTTSASRLFHLPQGGHIIDSPGIREFGLWHLPAETLAQYFVEFQPALGHCRFRDCRHHQEPGCAVQELIASGKITPQRLASYQQIREEMEENTASHPGSGKNQRKKI